MQGNNQDSQVIICTVNTVKSSLTMISWMRNNKFKRVTISPTISSDNTSLQFIYLKERGVSSHICKVTILDINDSQSAEIQSFAST